MDNTPDAQADFGTKSHIAVKPAIPESLPIDSEVESNLRRTAEKPVYITITYLDTDGRLKHFQKIDRGFNTDDILVSLVAIGEDAERNLIRPKAILELPRK